MTWKRSQVRVLSGPPFWDPFEKVVLRMEYSRDIDKLRHTAAHVMAQAVMELWPETKVAIGPAIDNGFYYDFDKKEPFTDDDLRKIEKAMDRIVQKNLPIDTVLDAPR